MKKAQCQSIAKTTQKQCEKPPLSDSSYCWLHYPKKETIEFFILGVFLTFLFQVLFNLATTSPEERKINLLQKQAAKLSIQNKQLITGKDTLIAQNKAFSNKLDKYQKDLTAKQQIITKLEKKAKNAERGITLNYWYNGCVHKQHGGNIKVDCKLNDTLEKFISLHDTRNFNELKKQCVEQITKTPKWPTPYLYLGVSFSHLGNHEEAVRNIEHFLETTKDMPSSYGYSSFRIQAESFIEQLKNK